MTKRPDKTTTTKSEDLAPFEHVSDPAARVIEELRRKLAAK